MQNRRAVNLFAVPAEVPISDLNTTPLIDVMLVLLIMFIITVPIATHKVPLDLPRPGGIRSEPVVHRLDLGSSGQVRLDSVLVPDSDLLPRLVAIAADPLAELHLRTDGEVRYDRFDHVLATIRRAGVARLGRVDNEKFVASLG